MPGSTLNRLYRKKVGEYQAVLAALRAGGNQKSQLKRLGARAKELRRQLQNAGIHPR